MAGVVMVGDCDILGALPTGSTALARPKSRTLTVPSARPRTFAGFEIAMNDPLSVRRFEGFRNLLCNRQHLVDGDRSTRDMCGRILALDQLHDEGAHSAGLLQAVNVRDVRMVQRGERLRLAGEPRESIRIVRERVRDDFERHVTIQFRVASPIHLAHAPFADLGSDFVDAEPGAGSESQE